MMLRYELKKLFSRTGGRLALLVLAIGIAVICYSAMLQISYTDENGDSFSGPVAARALREMKSEWAGPIDAAMITRAIEANQAMITSDEYNSDDVQRQNAAYHDTQGYETIRSLVAQTYDGMNEYDYFRIDSLQPEEAGALYERRVQNLKDWLARPDIAFTAAKEDYLISHYEAMETPLTNSYNDGWGTLFYDWPTLALFLEFLIIFLVSGIFPCERRWKSDAIFFSTKRGRHSAVRSKIVARILASTALYWLAVAAYSLVVLGLLGADGADGAYQLLKWKAFYNFSIGEIYVITIIGGYLGTLFLSLLAMLVSAATGSQVVGVIVPYVLIFGANFANSLLSSWEVLPNVLGLLPDQLLQLSIVLDDFNLYTLFGHVTGALPLLFGVYAVLCLLLAPVLYHIYRRTQVR